MNVCVCVLCVCVSLCVCLCVCAAGQTEFYWPSDSIRIKFCAE